MHRPAMSLLAKRLRSTGLEVQCFGYNTITGTLEANAAKLCASLARDTRPVALVGHSLGGLVSLQAAQALPQGQLTAMVLLGSPYQGAKAAQVLRRLVGPNSVGRSLHAWTALVEKPTVPAPVFTLSGTRSTGLGRVLCAFDEPNDGTVALSETHYPGATQCVLPVSHTGMLFSNPVAAQVAAWLNTPAP
jgi:pimeloyl-ACP methyl ester carboxylesterase